MPSKIEDFEEAFRVIKIDETNYVGAHPLRKPVNMARGVYGGHICAQALLVGMESAPEYVPDSFHLYFIGAGSSKIPMSYKVTKVLDGDAYASRLIEAVQDGQIKSNCMVTLRKKGILAQSGKSNKGINLDNPSEVPHVHKDEDPNKLHIVHHTDYIRNAYSDEFLDHELVPHEKDQDPTDRWITVYSGIDQPKSFKNPLYNYVGIADLSDSALLTTLARVMHLPWNPTEKNPPEEFDSSRDARALLKVSLNIIHIFHYNAMSLDHHIYFHSDDYTKAFDICQDWLTFTYQVKRLSNNRALVRGHLYNNEGLCIATVVQEGLTYLFSDVASQIKL